MIVFKTVLKIINKLKGMLILYSVLLVMISILNHTSGNNSNTLEFKESKPDIYIVNDDKEEGISLGLINYLKNHCYIKDIDASKKDAIDDAIFYRDINYCVYIPKNYNQDLLDGKEPSINFKSTGDYKSSYADMLIKKYVSTVLIYKDYYQGEELIAKVNDVVETEIKTELQSNLDSSTLQVAAKYFNFLNYAFLAGCVYCVCMVLSCIKENNVYKRTIISSYNYKKYNGIVFLTNLLLMLFIWLIYMVLSMIFFKKLMFSHNGVLFIINSFIYVTCALSIGYFIGNLTTNKNAIGGIVNVVAIGTSFLTGCFVPIEFMPKSVINIAKVLPTSYFVSNNELIKSLETFNFKSIKPFLVNSIVICVYTVAFICITLYISNKNRKIN